MIVIINLMSKHLARNNSLETLKPLFLLRLNTQQTMKRKANESVFIF